MTWRLSLFSLTILVVLPTEPSPLDVARLGLLGTASQQDHNQIPILAKVHAVTRPEVYPDLENARTDSLDVGESCRLRDERQPALLEQ